MKYWITVIMATGIFASGCSTAPRNSDYTRLNAETAYLVVPGAKGFELRIQHEKTQYAPDMAGLSVSCKSALLSLAYDLADQRKRKIQAINEQRIKLTTNRYIEAGKGTSFCEASVPVEWIGS
jgi:hypothetical protein